VRPFVLVVFAAAVTAGIAAAFAQQAGSVSPGGENFQSIVEQFDPLGGNLLGEPLAVSARIIPAAADRPAALAIAAEIAPGKHVYSLTQPKGGPLPTRIELSPSGHHRLLGPFRADPPPNTRVEQGPVWTGLEIQEHEGQVAWYAPLELAAGADPATLQIEGTLHAEVCETGGTCEPVEKQFTARIAKDAHLPPTIARLLAQSAGQKPKAETGTYQSKASAVKFTGRLIPAAVRPGESARIELTATLPENGRIYALADRDARVGTKPVLIVVQNAAGLMPHRAATDAAIHVDDSVPQFGRMQYHEGAVTWTLRLDAPRNASPGEYPISGLIGYQACEYGGNGNNICELPQAVRFEATLNVADKATDGSAPVAFAPAAGYSEVAAAAATFADFLEGQSSAATATAKDRVAESQPALRSSDLYDLELVNIEQPERSLTYYAALAFLGGIVLNLMPCVLPVIGLKVMSFVEQAHRSRAHALVLNLWFAAGIISVFLLLGVLAVSIGLSWGGQFGSTTFNVVVAAVVFAMSLSLLGVWEVPIPGFFGRGSLQAAAAQEGPLGAFLKGIVTTILATPCTAPFMASAVGWAITQPAASTLVVFASLGIGMASPYLLVGVYPELLRFLPKPGPWMETFKQLSGFILLGTVVFILSFIEPAAVVPTVALLLGVGLACWMIGRTPLTADFRDRLGAWAYAGAVVLVFVAVSFGWLYRVATATAESDWQPFSLERLKQVAVDQGRTVIVDFSAEWCINCKVLEQAVLHTEPVEQAIARAGAVTMYADYTNYPPEVDRTIKALGANGVPVIAIFPGHAPFKPFVFSGGYTQRDLVDALEKSSAGRPPAGSSVAEAGEITPPLN
jgi:thiol:disulfide interchange protein